MTVPDDIPVQDLPDYVAGLTDAHEVVLPEGITLLKKKAFDDPAVNLRFRMTGRDAPPAGSGRPGERDA